MLKYLVKTGIVGKVITQVYPHSSTPSVVPKVKSKIKKGRHSQWKCN